MAEYDFEMVINIRMDRFPRLDIDGLWFNSPTILQGFIFTLVTWA